MIRDTLTMTKRSLRHTIRSIDTIITVCLMPIAILLLFVYVFGGAFGFANQVNYVDFITPGIIVMTIVSGISYASLRLNNDFNSGIINRFRTMPVAPSSILGGQATSSVISNVVSVILVLAVAFVVGFRSGAGVGEWLLTSGLILLFTIATTWLAIVFGLLAKTAEGAGAFSYILIFLIFISSAFVPTTGMAPALRAFAENQPLTPIIETMRSLLSNGVAGDRWVEAVSWCIGILAVSYVVALYTYRRKSV